ncbi:transglutaminase TgpA family protein [Paramicrobacterium chengjingii]|uniref:Transglutaminase domain-containing protein n=1 Tax=Paramicrobacterium chengjingii TaxID=2769067 RepID=A0ABX6YM86_9MICO|nr:DUF3488 and transglutaminase-like domain-containing protein [Microbacterium chengjingii]QPZ39790.1 transglutaminase domain-containing protein [Microbacterium chengjingii]
MADERRVIRRGARADGRRHVPLSVALALLIVASLSAFLPVIDGTGWWLGCILVVIAVNGAAAVARVAGLSRLLGSFVGAVTGVFGITAVCGGGTALIGLVPTPATIGHFVELSQSAGESIYRQSIPAQADAGITFLLIFASLMASVTLDLMAAAAGTAAPVGLVALAIVVPPSILLDEVPLIPFAATAIAYLFVLWADRARERARGGLTRMLAVGVVAASVAGIGAAAVPGFYGTNPFIVSAASSTLASGVSPLLHLGEDLQRTGNSVQFRYTTSAEDPERFRLMTLESFDGTTWASAGERSGLFTVNQGTSLVRSDTSDSLRGTLISTTVKIAGLRDRVLPIPDGAIEIHGVEGTWLWDPADETMRSRSDSTVGLNYSVSSIRALPTAEQLRAAGIPDRGIFAAERELPDDIPATITRTLDKVIDGIENPYERAYAIQSFLRDGDFAYSLSAPVSQGYDGDSLGVIATFLERRAGYCVHFAATMATMARMIDLPSRIVLGFLPGEDDADGTHTVRSDDLHAWPELYFEGVGWVPFEPTPGRGGTPSYAPEATSTADAAGPDDLDPRTVERSSAPDASETPDAEAAAPTQREEPEPNLAPAGITFLVLIALLSIPALVRRLRRIRRLRRARSRTDSVTDAWAEIADTARDLGWEHPIGDTPRMLSERIRSRVGGDGEVGDAIDRLVRHVERARFGPQRDTESLEADADARIIIAAIESAASRFERVKKTIWPASVLSRGVQPTANLAR